MMKAAFRNSCTLILLVSSATVARSTTFLRMSIEQLAQRADLIVRAHCTGSMVESRGGEIWTVTFFEVREVWKGEAPSVARVRLLGGRTAQLTSHVAGVPHFRIGEDVILFLDAERNGEYSILTWQQGTFRIHRNSPRADAPGYETISQDTGDYQSFQTSPRVGEEVGADALQSANLRDASLETFHHRVRAAIGAAPSAMGAAAGPNGTASGTIGAVSRKVTTHPDASAAPSTARHGKEPESGAVQR